jgi:16S rRNA (guanine1207-N2)-methyltransferase
VDQPSDSAPEPIAVAASMDPVDRILLEQAAPWLSAVGADQVVVVDDVTGELAVAATGITGPGRLRVHCDSLGDETRVSTAFEAAGAGLRLVDELGDALLAGAQVVLARLPKSLAALDELAESVARYAHPDVRLVTAGRTKHMTHGMNRVLGRHFDRVSASLGQQKSRALIASEPHPSGPSAFPACERHDDLDLTVCAHGAAFAGSGVDLGTRLLLTQLPAMPSAARRVADLGCGTGVLATAIARQLPQAQVLAVDDSSAACRSTAATAEANGVRDRVSVQRLDLLAGGLPGELDLALCNPPFHRGTARDSEAAFAMFAAAGRALRPGGELWTVYNTHLPYLAALRRLVGPTRIVRQDPHYIVARSQWAPAPTEN